MILFNALKHHLAHIRQVIEAAKQQQIDLHRELLKIGNSQMDLYIGNLSEQEISDEVIHQLTALDYHDYLAYQNWMEDGNGYRNLTLSDQSEWVLRMGHELPLYVHIHPGRYAPHTIRVKATTLKTAIYLASQQITQLESLTTEEFNEYRLGLGLSPVRSIKDVSALEALLELLVKL